MTPFIIIIIIVIIILFTFQGDKNKMLDVIDSHGGLQEKYKIFLSFFIKDYDFKITKITKAYVVLGINETSVNMQLMLTQSFKTVLINWNSNTKVGSVNLRWEFPEFMDQNSMIEKVMMDVAVKQQQLINKRVDKTMSDFDDNPDFI